MYNANLIVLSYHRFTQEEDSYVFSRTYKQFRNDLETKDFDWITIDDGHNSIIKACKMMSDHNIRAKLFINPGLVGTESYCSWSILNALSQDHDIENHSFDHVRLPALEDPKDIYWQIAHAQEEIEKNIGRTPRFFVPPWNNYDERVESICAEMGIQIVKNRINMKNITP